MAKLPSCFIEHMGNKVADCFKRMLFHRFSSAFWLRSSVQKNLVSAPVAEDIHAESKQGKEDCTALVDSATASTSSLISSFPPF